MMNAVELIIAKRNGRELSPAEIAWMVGEFVENRLPEYQMSAFLMAVVWRGMTPRETAAYTRAMIDSGDRMTFPHVTAPKVDKHSTGGVGDKVSLPLAPLAAATGLAIPMMSGRGLSHTGGTLDKLESIPGFRVRLDAAEAAKILERLGFFLIGQTDRIAPADKKLYALRDVTGTVESIPLICGSILSKKVAAGVEALVMDVKTGSGAFMQTFEDAEALGRSLVDIGTELGLRMVACITDMDQPLGRAVGNAIEMRESIECLRGGGPPDLRGITLALAAEMLMLGGRASSYHDAETIARKALDGGAALEIFRAVIEAQGGDPAVLDDPERLALAPDETVVRADHSGCVVGFRTRDVGVACNVLGAGRAKVTDEVDHGVGIEVLVKKGVEVRAGDELFRVIHRNGHGLPEALRLLHGAVRIADFPPTPAPRSLVIKRILPEKSRG